MPDYWPKCSKCLAEDLLQLLKFSTTYIICWYSVQGYRSACVCGKHFMRLLSGWLSHSQSHKHTCGLQASVVVLFIMKKVQCSFYCAYVLCRNLMTQIEEWGSSNWYDWYSTAIKWSCKRLHVSEHMEASFISAETSECWENQAFISFFFCYDSHKQMRNMYNMYTYLYIYLL